ncbi:MAG TPA: hypothetical protein VL175_04195 [Pirellulales bacterium]|nr:hypothetical protein [Pirellulales bacterium]
MSDGSHYNPVEPVPIPTDSPTPFGTFVVRPEELFWEWWRGLNSDATEDPSFAGKTKTRGRKKATYQVIQSEKELAADWKRAREAGEPKVDFAERKKMTVAELDRLLDRVAKRERGSE